MAERVGFEPTSPVLPGYPLSRRALSTAQTPLPPESLAETCFFSNTRGARYLRAAKKACMVCAHSSARTPPSTSTLWFSAR